MRNVFCQVSPRESRCVLNDRMSDFRGENETGREIMGEHESQTACGSYIYTNFRARGHEWMIYQLELSIERCVTRLFSDGSCSENPGYRLNGRLTRDERGCLLSGCCALVNEINPGACYFLRHSVARNVYPRGSKQPRLISVKSQ